MISPTKIAGIIMIMIGIFLLFVFIYLGITSKDVSGNVPCYDKKNNMIQGVTCHHEAQKYQLFVFLGVGLIFSYIFVVLGIAIWRDF